MAIDDLLAGMTVEDLFRLDRSMRSKDSIYSPVPLTPAKPTPSAAIGYPGGNSVRDVSEVMRWMHEKRRPQPGGGLLANAGNMAVNAVKELPMLAAMPVMMAGDPQGAAAGLIDFMQQLGEGVDPIKFDALFAGKSPAEKALIQEYIQKSMRGEPTGDLVSPEIEAQIRDAIDAGRAAELRGKTVYENPIASALTAVGAAKGVMGTEFNPAAFRRPPPPEYIPPTPKHIAMDPRPIIEGEYSVETPSPSGNTIRVNHAGDRVSTQLVDPYGEEIGSINAGAYDSGHYTMDATPGLPPEFRGRGDGAAMYQATVDAVHNRGFDVASDKAGISPEIKFMMDALEQRGYRVNRNPRVVEDPSGATFAEEFGESVYTIPRDRDSAALYSKAAPEKEALAGSAALDEAISMMGEAFRRGDDKQYRWWAAQADRLMGNEPPPPTGAPLPPTRRDGVALWSKAAPEKEALAGAAADVPQALGRQKTLSRTAAMLDDPRYAERQPVVEWVKTLSSNKFPADEPARLAVLRDLRGMPLKERLTKADVQAMLNKEAPELETILVKNPTNSVREGELFVRDPNEYQSLAPEITRSMDAAILKARDLKNQLNELEWEGFIRMGYDPKDYNNSLSDLFKDKGQEIWERTKSGGGSSDVSSKEFMLHRDKITDIENQINQIEKEMDDKYGINYANRHELYAISDKQKALRGRLSTLSEEQSRLIDDTGQIPKDNYERNAQLNEEMRGITNQISRLEDQKQELSPQHRYDGHSWARQEGLSEPLGRTGFYTRNNQDGTRTLVIDNFQKPTEGSGQRDLMPPEHDKRAYDLMTQSALNYAREKGYRDVEWLTGDEQNARWGVDVPEFAGEWVRDVNSWQKGDVVIYRGQDGYFIDNLGDIPHNIFPTPEEAMAAADKIYAKGTPEGDLRPLYDRQMPKLMEKYGQGNRVEPAKGSGREEPDMVSVDISYWDPADLVDYAVGVIEKWPDEKRKEEFGTADLDRIGDQLSDFGYNGELQDFVEGYVGLPQEEVPKRRAMNVQGQKPSPMLYSRTGLDKDLLAAGFKMIENPEKLRLFGLDSHAKGSPRSAEKFEPSTGGWSATPYEPAGRYYATSKSNLVRGVSSPRDEPLTGSGTQNRLLDYLEKDLGLDLFGGEYAPQWSAGRPTKDSKVISVDNDAIRDWVENSDTKDKNHLTELLKTVADFVVIENFDGVPGYNEIIQINPEKAKIRGRNTLYSRVPLPATTARQEAEERFRRAKEARSK